MSHNPKKREIDLYIISRVRDIRLELNLSQEDLAAHLDMTKSYITQVENPKNIAKYTNAHLNELAKLFDCSIRDFFPQKYL